MIQNFVLSNKPFCQALGFMAYYLCQRPSSFLEWTDESDWLQRLYFDMSVMVPVIENMNGGEQLGVGRHHR